MPLPLTQLSNSCKVSGSRIWWDVELFFQPRGAWYNECNTCIFRQKKKKKKEAAALFNRRQRCMNCDSEWMQGWPGFALNMRAIRDSCQPPATFGRKSETEWVQEPRASAGTRPAVRRHLLLQVLLQHRPLNEPSLWFQPCPVLAHFHYKTKRQCQGNREQNGFVLLPAWQGYDWTWN